jgi:pimeloyl-ACP methyl ester carboxylesterase
MIPSILMKIDKLPLTINGKVDRRALPATEFTSTDKYIAPRSEIEKQLVKIWSEILDVRQENIGINDDFFKLGGNSILSIKLLSKINHIFNSQLKISDLFVSKTINQLKNKVALTRTYLPIVKLNNTTNKPNLFMIHPGHAGCEVYQELAERLSEKFSCFGVDSYNLYHTNKINKLTDLAKYYLQSIKRIMEETKQDNYYILGWSLGGVIALEIAALLESEGITNIKLYLLDSVYHYTGDESEDDNALKKHLLAQGFSQEYIDNILTVSEVDEMLNKQTISYKLQNSKIVLYKALLRDDTYDAYEAIKSADQEIINNIKYNNIDQAVANLTQLSVIQLEQAHHSNILGQIINFDF